jgi:AraC family transcriptional regulator, transcriptional activator of the genes for pyochelin and ferripyochelin receptors
MRSFKVNQFGNPILKTKMYDFVAIEQAKQIIEKDPSRHFCLNRLADMVGINENKLKTGFRELFQTSPYKYLVKLRLEKARELLEESDATVQEISDKVGFESYNGLSVAFKSAFQLSPTQYRKWLDSVHTGVIYTYKPNAEKPTG